MALHRTPARSIQSRCGESRRAEQGLNLGHPFADRNFLRTFLFAFVTGGANAGPRGFRDKYLILEARARKVLVEKRFVVDFKIARDIHSVRAGHSIDGNIFGPRGFPSTVGKRMQPKPSTEAFQSNLPNLRNCMGMKRVEKEAGSLHSPPAAGGRLAAC